MTMDMDTVKMSHEEMIDTLKGLVFGTFDRTTVKEREALDMAIKALEQDSILGKIRAEIADLADEPTYGDYQYGFSYGLMRAAQIIDKYKAEM